MASCCGSLQGVLKLLLTCQLRYLTTWPAVMISGLTSIILAFTILALSSWLFNESLKVIGIFFGADLCLTGVSLMLIAFMARLGHKAKETHEPLLAESGRKCTSSCNCMSFICWGYVIRYYEDTKFKVSASSTCLDILLYRNIVPEKR
ncbi:unnamed protein product [Sphagnum jensenii]|uniref:Uncharacterized protein n=1 Tax=Sphagnum jensenii TaxID=128206 RepID=A0ABP0W691_9BRYO